MPKHFVLDLNLGPAFAGASLEAQLYDEDGALTGVVITTGFIEFGTTKGLFAFHHDYPDAFAAAGGSVVVSEVAGDELVNIGLNPADFGILDVAGNAALVDAVWDEPTSGHLALGSFGQALNTLRSGTAQAGAATTITLDAGASALDSFYNEASIFITAGTGAGQVRVIESYVGATKVATVSDAWVTNPDATSQFVILAIFTEHPAAASAIAGEVWDEPRASHTTPGTFGEAVAAVASYGTLVADVATAVWAAGARTLTSFGTLVADVTTAIWAAGTRTLTSFGTLTTDTAAAVWNKLTADHTAVGSFGQAHGTRRAGTAQAGGTNTITLDAGASATNDLYHEATIIITGGTGAGQGRIIETYNGATKVATVNDDWEVVPDATSQFVLTFQHTEDFGGLVTIGAEVAESVWAYSTRTLTGFGTLAADVAAAVWAYATRTLTMTAAAITAALSGSTLTIRRGDTVTISITGLGNITSRTKLWFTVKESENDADTASIIQIIEGTGLVYLNGAAATAAQGSLVVTDATAGNVTITLAAAATEDLELSSRLYYDLQYLSAAGVTTLTEGNAKVVRDATRSIS